MYLLPLKSRTNLSTSDDERVSMLQKSGGLRPSLYCDIDASVGHFSRRARISRRAYLAGSTEVVVAAKDVRLGKPEPPRIQRCKPRENAGTSVDLTRIRWITRDVPRDVLLGPQRQRVGLWGMSEVRCNQAIEFATNPIICSTRTVPRAQPGRCAKAVRCVRLAKRRCRPLRPSDRGLLGACDYATERPSPGSRSPGRRSTSRSSEHG